MTNEDRQTVIQALEAALEVLDDVPTWSNAGYAAEAARKALAILRWGDQSPDQSQWSEHWKRPVDMQVTAASVSREDR